MAEMEEDRGSANSEMRYITIQLMRLAQRRKTTFRKMAQEFVENAYSLAELLQNARYDAKASGGAKKGATPNHDEKD